VTGVFAGNLVGFFEDAEGAESDVFEIADGSSDEIEAATFGAGLLARFVGNRFLRGRIEFQCIEVGRIKF
jgi:hypothetical protein